MGEAKRRREAQIRLLVEGAGVEPDLAEHILDRQIAPQETARDLRARGLDVEVAMVDTTPGVEGFEVMCAGCGRTATLSFALPAGTVVLCPPCQKKRSL